MLVKIFLVKINEDLRNLYQCKKNDAIEMQNDAWKSLRQ